MEPWPFSHGYAMGEIVEDYHFVPSMEPWPFSHGYAGTAGTVGGGDRYLQWSHGPLAMDTRRSVGLRRLEIGAFNGAMAL